MRTTSLEAWHHINETGILGRARTKTYGILYNKGPLAQFEFERFEKPSAYGGTLSKRVNELEEMGLVKCIGDKINPLSGRRCMVYDVTLKVPRNKYKKKPKICPMCGHRFK